MAVLKLNNVTQLPIPLTTKTDTATLTASEQGIIIANKATAFTINLPAVSGNSGLFYHIKSIGAGAVTGAQEIISKNWCSFTITRCMYLPPSSKTRTCFKMYS